eukprot:scaffold87022_cov19-Tisochrysis_lutea.AAC.2
MPMLRRDNFTRQEAEAFVKEAVALAMASDASSGGCMRFVTIDAEGAHHSYVRGDQVPYKDMPQPISSAAAAGMIIGRHLNHRFRSSGMEDSARYSRWYTTGLIRRR